MVAKYSVHITKSFILSYVYKPFLVYFVTTNNTMNIVITGGSQGLGLAIAKQFAAQQHTLFLCSRNEALLNHGANELQQTFKGCTVYVKAVDVSDKTACSNFANWVLQFGVPDILVNNAGYFVPGSIYNEEDGVLENMLTTNLMSAYHITRAFLPSMMSQKSGHIFNICSIASLQAYSNGGSYSISKFALLGFSKNLREELKPYNIKVTAVMPGAAYTNSWVGSGVDEKRIMEANDVAKMVYASSLLSAQACVEDIVLRPQLGDL
jgi:short-subunit dehydrogenase